MLLTDLESALSLWVWVMVGDGLVVVLVTGLETGSPVATADGSLPELHHSVGRR